MKLTDLKPCPFCGYGKPSIRTGVVLPGLTMILCPNCGATVSFQQKERKHETIEAWNRRDTDALN